MSPLEEQGGKASFEFPGSAEPSLTWVTEDGRPWGRASAGILYSQSPWPHMAMLPAIPQLFRFTAHVASQGRSRNVPVLRGVSLCS